MGRGTVWRWTKAAARRGIFPCFVGFLALTGTLSAEDFCLPPEAPIGGDPALVAAYRAEILGDYERYWSESSGYIACLDAERGRALAAMRASVTNYEAVFHTAPTPDPFPDTKGD
jgi:hypothetical protein